MVQVDVTPMDSKIPELLASMKTRMDSYDIKPEVPLQVGTCCVQGSWKHA